MNEFCMDPDMPIPPKIQQQIIHKSQRKLQPSQQAKEYANLQKLSTLTYADKVYSLIDAQQSAQMDAPATKLEIMAAICEDVPRVFMYSQLMPEATASPDSVSANLSSHIHAAFEAIAATRATTSGIRCSDKTARGQALWYQYQTQSQPYLLELPLAVTSSPHKYPIVLLVCSQTIQAKKRFTPAQATNSTTPPCSKAKPPTSPASPTNPFDELI
jgi:hypothetical protein